MTEMKGPGHSLGCIETEPGLHSIQSSSKIDEAARTYKSRLKSRLHCT